MLLQQLLDWYDRDDASDDELEQIVSHAREIVSLADADKQCDRCEYVLYDFDSNRLLSGEVYPSYADAAADAAGLDDVLILRLPLPFKEPEEPEEPAIGVDDPM
jgi:hypothetical protein